MSGDSQRERGEGCAVGGCAPSERAHYQKLVAAQFPQETLGPLNQSERAHSNIRHQKYVTACEKTQENHRH